MKIAFLLSTLSGKGGPQRFMLEVGRRLTAKGHNVCFVTWHFSPQLTFEGFQGAKVKSTGDVFFVRPILRDLSYRWRTSSPHVMDMPLSIVTNLFLILKAAKEVKPDVIIISSGHTFTGFTKLFYHNLMVCRYPSLPMTLSGSLLAKLLRPFEVFAIKNSVSFINSQIMANCVSSQLGIELPVIHPGADYDNFSSLKRLDDGRTLLYFSQIRSNKNQMFLVDLMPSLLKQHDVTLILAGLVESQHRPYLKSLEEHVKELGLTGKVRIVTEIPRQVDISELYSKATVYLHPAAGEPFGMTVVEAMASGLPVIIHREVGARETIVNGVSGFAVGDDPKEWVDCIQRLLTDKELYRNVSRESRLRAKEFSWDATTEKFESLIVQRFQAAVFAKERA